MEHRNHLFDEVVVAVRRFMYLDNPHLVCIIISPDEELSIIARAEEIFKEPQNKRKGIAIYFFTDVIPSCGL